VCPATDWPAHLQSPSIAGCLCVPRCRQHEWQDSTTTWPAAAVSCSRSQRSMRSSVDTAPMQMVQSLQFTMRANLQQYRAASMSVSHRHTTIQHQTKATLPCTPYKLRRSCHTTSDSLHATCSPHPPTHMDSLDRCQHIHMCLTAVLDCEAVRRHISRPPHHSAPVHARHSMLIHTATSNCNHATCCADLDAAQT
jgi:hypothetical protein